MTPKYKKVAELVNAGLSKEQIMSKLKISSSAVDNRKHIAKKKRLLGKAPEGQPVKASTPAPDIKSAIIYLRQACQRIGPRPTYAELLTQLALKTLLGEDR